MTLLSRGLGSVVLALPVVLATTSTNVNVLAATRLQVRGAARIHAHAARANGDLVLSGVLTDDGEIPIPGVGVRVSLELESDRKQRAILDRSHTTECASAPRRSPVTLATDSAPFEVITDEAGRFCVRFTPPHDRWVARFSWKGNELVAGAIEELGVDFARSSVVLKVEPRPGNVLLDAPVVEFDVLAHVEEDGAARALVGLPIHLSVEQGKVLATETADAAGRAHFALDPKRLGTPGRVELRLGTEASKVLSPAEVAMAVDLQAHAQLRADESVAPGNPAEGIPLHVRVDWGGGPIDGGIVEARVGDILVGAAPVAGGEARVLATFSPPEGSAQVPLRLRYSQASPWLLPSEEIVVQVPIRTVGPTRKILLLCAGGLVFGYLVFARLGPRRSRKEPEPERRAPRGEAEIAVVQRATHADRAGWSGAVVDAHDGRPLVDITLTLERPGFDYVHVLARTKTGPDGRFRIPKESRVGDEIVAEGDLYAALRRPAPPYGELAIALVLRRRRLLDRLVAWARRRGSPFDVRPEPTPGHVRKMAAEEPEAARWAEAIERAAFGPEAVNQAIESEIDKLAPGLAGVRVEKEMPPAPPVSDPDLARPAQAVAGPMEKQTRLGYGFATERRTEKTLRAGSRAALEGPNSDASPSARKR